MEVYCQYAMNFAFAATWLLLSYVLEDSRILVGLLLTTSLASSSVTHNI